MKLRLAVFEETKRSTTTWGSPTYWVNLCLQAFPGNPRHESKFHQPEKESTKLQFPQLSCKLANSARKIFHFQPRPCPKTRGVLLVSTPSQLRGSFWLPFKLHPDLVPAKMKPNLRRMQRFQDPLKVARPKTYCQLTDPYRKLHFRPPQSHRFNAPLPCLFEPFKRISNKSENHHPANITTYAYLWEQKHTHCETHTHTPTPLLHKLQKSICLSNKTQRHLLSQKPKRQPRALFRRWRGQGDGDAPQARERRRGAHEGELVRVRLARARASFRARESVNAVSPGESKSGCLKRLKDQIPVGPILYASICIIYIYI